MESPSQWIVLAHILRPQGRKGEVLADLFTDFPERFDQRPQVWLAPSGFAELASSSVAGEPSGGSNPGASVQPAQVAAHWLPVGRNAGRIVFHFAGIDSIEKAQELAGKDVLVPLAERMPLPAGAAYISDLIGCTVYDRDQPLGVVSSVQFPTSPDGLRRLEEAAPLLAVKLPEGEEVLVPFAGALLLGVDLAAKSIRMTLPEGLAEINRAATDSGEEKG
jgi:16S rRNA processing protein RimM